MWAYTLNIGFCKIMQTFCAPAWKLKILKFHVFLKTGSLLFHCTFGSLLFPYFFSELITKWTADIYLYPCFKVDIAASAGEDASNCGCADIVEHDQNLVIFCGIQKLNFDLLIKVNLFCDFFG